MNVPPSHLPDCFQVVAAAGAVDHDKLVELVQAKFSSLPAENKADPAKLIAQQPGFFTGSEVRRADCFELSGVPKTFPVLAYLLSITVFFALYIILPLSSDPSYSPSPLPLQVRIRDDDLPLCNFAIAYQGAGWKDPDAVALMVMQTMLGAWSKSSGGGTALG